MLGAGGSFSCGVTTNGRAYCWGYGNVGQTGDGKTSNRLWPKVPVAGGLDFTRVSAGHFHACGETTNKRAHCWGWNHEGAIGDGTKTMRLSPVPVAGGLLFSQVSGGSSHTCGRTPAAVAYCWGWNGYGKLGGGSFSDQLTPSPVAGSD